MPVPSAADLRFYALLAAVAVYAGWGSPTPDSPGVPEFLTGLLLLAAAGIGPVAAALVLPPRAPWRIAAWVLLVYGLTVPVAAGVLAGNPVEGMLRDVIPFLFLLLPLFLTPVAERRPVFRSHLTLAAAALGIVFALRVLAPVPGLAATAGDPLYLANAPTVLFAGLYAAGAAGFALYRARGGAKAWAAAVLCAAAAFPPLAVMAMIGQRASMGAALACAAALILTAAAKRPLRAAVPALALLLLAAWFWPALSGLALGLARKTEMVGFNMRVQEARTVLDALGASLPAVLFGKGWGAAVASPAVGGMTVNFTHSLVTTYWLKTGLAGLCAALGYLAALGLMLPRLIFRNPVLGLALAAPFLIDVLLYASFKSLDFGLILLLIALWGEAGQGCRSSPFVVSRNSSR